MLQVIKQTDEEKMTMYMKASKKKLIKMLIQCNKCLDIVLNSKVEHSLLSFAKPLVKTSDMCPYDLSKL